MSGRSGGVRISVHLCMYSDAGVCRIELGDPTGAGYVWIGSCRTCSNDNQGSNSKHDLRPTFRRSWMCDIGRVSVVPWYVFLLLAFLLTHGSVLTQSVVLVL